MYPEIYHNCGGEIVRNPMFAYCENCGNEFSEQEEMRIIEESMFALRLDCNVPKGKRRKSSDGSKKKD